MHILQEPSVSNGIIFLRPTFVKQNRVLLGLPPIIGMFVAGFQPKSKELYNLQA
jgi:hypothetical protein